MVMFARKVMGDEDMAARRARNVFYGLGITFVVLGLFMDTLPALAAVTSALAAKICAGIGAAILAIGRFGSDAFVRRCQGRVTGWF
jgi:hypothetical protein